jgi:hypothetical protein
MKKFAFLLVVAGVLLPLAAWSEGGEEPTASLNFLVIRDYNSKPIRNASVVLHPVNDKGKQARGGFELKTDDEGKTSFDGVPYGKLRVQVLAPGFQTFGDDYDIQKPTVEITVKLKRPQSQYSIYQDSNNTPKKDASAEKDAKPSGDQKPQ